MTPPSLLHWLRHPRVRRTPACLPSGAVADQHSFADFLRFERIRAERSGRRILLLMVTTREFGNRNGETIIRSVAARMRDTDVFGWYEEEHTLGILITETKQVDAATINVIVGKVMSAVADNLESKILQELVLTYSIFPGGQSTGAGPNIPHEFYPEFARRHTLDIAASAGKRIVDIVGSAAALIVLLPIFLLIAIIVKSTSEGPILFCQQRLGLRGRCFCFLKFRTMYVNNDPEIHKAFVSKLIAGQEDVRQQGRSYKLTDDPRVTPAGRWLRKSSCDELPQFLNVLVGQMSLVGPRPPLPYELEHYHAWHRRRVMELKPGLTGPWQIGGRSMTSFDDMVRMDLHYLKDQSLWTDCKILLRTPAAVVSARGAF
jgi:lipopolysaccharide/colanic/teichoic acid biosynthesis glycosyltransferase